ncbi:MAG: PD40 domain-containing protein [Xanthomonadaceae bacterium]|nr:PD40 domain-containing protein [Xanthomonadaceae bacterium]
MTPQLLLLKILILAVQTASADPYVQVGTAKTKKTIVAIQASRVTSPDLGEYSKQIQSTITNDLLFMDQFKILAPTSFIEDESQSGVALGSFKMTDWSSIGAEFLVKSSLKSEDGQLALEAYIYEVASGKQVLARRYTGDRKDHKIISRTFGNQIIETLTGLPGIFLTKIAMSCDRSGKKEIYVMDFDGTNVKQVTNHRSIAFAPAWNTEGTKLAYSLYTKRRDNVKNIDLYEFDFATNRVKLLSDRKGINSGAYYHPKKPLLAMTMSFLGNPEVFTLNQSNNTVTRLTNSFGFDVDPSFSPDGSKITFVSSRSGMPMVYSMNEDGSKIQRLTYAGRYNATPNWSPNGSKISFAGWIDSSFDIFIMNSDGSHIERLTKNMGNNEDPYYSPDGNFIVFSSSRAGGKNIYVMNIDGSYVKRLTFGMGQCVAPKWSRPLVVIPKK